MHTCIMHTTVTDIDRCSQAETQCSVADIETHTHTRAHRQVYNRACTVESDSSTFERTHRLIVRYIPRLCRCSPSTVP